LGNSDAVDGDKEVVTAATAASHTISSSATEQDATATTSTATTPTPTNHNNHMAHFFTELCHYKPALLLSILFCLSFGYQAFTGSFAMYCKSRFQFGPLEYGRVLSFCGCTWSITNAFLLPQLKKTVKHDRSLLILGTCSLLMGRIGLALAGTWQELIVGEGLVVFGAAVSFTLLSSLLSTTVPQSLVGTFLGFSSSLESMCGIFVPPLVGVLFETYGDMSGALVSACSTACGVFLLLVCWREGEGGRGARKKRRKKE